MNSKQEKLIAILSEKSFGAPYIFAPEEYRKGNAKREPADLVWACNNCIILFYMIARKNDVNVTSETLKKRKQNLINHNIRQAKGWNKEWRNGRNLVGSNRFNSFSISYNDYQHKIIVSIIDYSNQEGSFHHELLTELDAKICLTISQQNFESLVKIDSTAIDFILVGLKLKIDSIKDAHVQFSNIIKKYYESSKKYAYDTINYISPTKLPKNEIIAATNDVIRQFRTTLLLENEKKPIANDIAAIFNDIKMPDYYQLIIMLAQRLTLHDSQQEKMVVYVHDLTNYIFVVGIAHIQNFRLMQPKLIEATKKCKELNTSKSIIMLEVDSMNFDFILSFSKRKDKSHSELLLENN